MLLWTFEVRVMKWINGYFSDLNGCRSILNGRFPFVMRQWIKFSGIRQPSYRSTAPKYKNSTTLAVSVYRRWAARRQQHDYIKADLLEYNDDLESLNKALFKLYNEAHTYYWKGGLHTQLALGVCGQVSRSVIGLFQRDDTFFAHVCYLSIYAQRYTSVILRHAGVE